MSLCQYVSVGHLLIVGDKSLVKYYDRNNWSITRLESIGIYHSSPDLYMSASTQFFVSQCALFNKGVIV